MRVRRPEFVKLYGVVSVTTISRSAFGVSAKISRLGLDSKQDLIAFTDGTRTTAALTQSEALTVAEQPLDHPLYGAEVDLGIVRNDLAGVSGGGDHRQASEARCEAGRHRPHVHPRRRVAGGFARARRHGRADAAAESIAA